MKQQHFESFESESSFNLKAVLMPYLRAWPFFIFSIFVALSIAYIYLKPKSSIFQSEALVLVRDEKGGSEFASMDLFEDLGIVAPKSNMFNEIQAFQSQKLLKNVVRELRLQEKCLKKTLWYQKNTPFYNEVPVYTNLTSDLLEALPHSVKYVIEMKSDKSFHLNELFTKNGQNFERSLGTFQFDSEIEGLLYKFKISKSENPQFKFTKGTVYQIELYPIDIVAKQLKSRISVASFSKETSIISIKCSGLLSDENNDILSSLIRQHEHLMFESKTEMAKNTSTFINGRMQIIEEELSGVEELGESYKSKYGFFDLTYEAGTLLSKTDALERQIIEYNVQLEMVTYFANHLKEKKSKHSLLPVNIGFEDININTLTERYNEIYMLYNELTVGSTAKNPKSVELLSQLDAILENLTLSISKYQMSIEKSIDFLEKKEQRYQSELAMMPSHERDYREIERQQQIKEALYIYLLQKREENEIAIAGTVGSVSIMNEPLATGVPISPNRKTIYLTAFLIGLLFPFVFIYFKNLFDTKVRSVLDLEALKIPCLGEISKYHGNKDYYLMNSEERNSCGEGFRRLRTNINFMLSDKDSRCKTILVSSSFSNEGKTFITANLATAIALTNKRVLIVGADLRKPRVLKYFNVENALGITDYLIDEKLTVADVVHDTNENKGIVRILPSGPVPPNPAEMMESQRFKDLMNELKQRFDYIVIDTAPIGIVSDLLPLMDSADLLIYAVRYGVLDKSSLKLISRLHAENKIQSFATLLNGVDHKANRYGYTYGYGYSYGYGQEYYEYGEESNTSNKIVGFLKKLLRRK
jgi:capsular exopolysaccharide synthesis family protein